VGMEVTAVKRVELIVGDCIPLTKGGLSELVYLRDVEPILRPDGRPIRNLLVRCLCGEEFTSRLDNIRNKHTTQCWGCAHTDTGKSAQKDLTGGIFGRLTVIGISGRTARKQLLFRCVCICGKEVSVRGATLLNGATTSCGCYMKERISETSGTNWKPGEIVGVFTILEKLKSDPHGHQKYRVLNNETKQERCLFQKDIRNITDPQRYLTRLIRARVKQALKYKDIRKTQSAINGLPWSVEDILKSIGPRPEGDYHLEHICPLAQATTEDEVITLNNPRNLRWMLASENLSKGASRTEEGAQLCRELLGREWKDPSE